MTCIFLSFSTVHVFQSHQANGSIIMKDCVLRLVGCFGFNGPLRQYFSLYRACALRNPFHGGTRLQVIKLFSCSTQLNMKF